MKEIMKMKRVICTLLCLVMVLPLAACGQKPAEAPAATNAPAAPAATDAPAPTETPAAPAKLSGTVSTDGSTSMEKVIGALGEAFMEANPGAIGYASLASVKDTVRSLKVGGVAPSEETVKDGTYAIQRPFVLATRTDAGLNDAAQAFFDYITSGKADAIIVAAGVVPAR